MATQAPTAASESLSTPRVVPTSPRNSRFWSLWKPGRGLLVTGSLSVARAEGLGWPGRGKLQLQL
eukprot:1812029-Rhodomonas_salina.2